MKKTWKRLCTLTTDENGNTDIAEVKAGTVYIKENRYVISFFMPFMNV